jgi:hypothetical protein
MCSDLPLHYPMSLGGLNRRRIAISPEVLIISWLLFVVDIPSESKAISNIRFLNVEARANQWAETHVFETHEKCARGNCYIGCLR